MQATHFSANMQVNQMPKNLSFVRFIALGLLCGAPGFWLGFLIIDNEQDGWLISLQMLGFIGCIALTIVGIFLGFILCFMFEDYRDKIRGIPKPFSKETLVTIDENGLYIKSLGLAKWSDVLSLEGVPDADHLLIVYTTPYGKLMLYHDAHTLATAPNDHINQNRAAILDGAQSKSSSAFEFKAVVFHWPIFYTWILSGYLFAIAIVIGLFVLKPDAGFFKLAISILVLAPACAWLVWTIPLWQLSLFAGKRTKTFELSQDRLTSKDGKIDIDLHRSKVKLHHKNGIGYVLDFMTVKPQNGRRLDVLVYEEEMTVLQKNFNVPYLN